MLKHLCSLQSPPSAVDEFASINEFLQINGPLTTESYRVSQEILTVPAPCDSFDQTRLKLSFNIQIMMQKLDKSAIEIVQIRLQIAWDLKALYNAYDSSSTNTFYLFIKEEFGLNKRSYQYYQSYFRFLVKYPLFQRIPVAFTFLRTKTTQIELWFNTVDCSRLSVNDPTSKAYWTGTQPHATAQNPAPTANIFAVTPVQSIAISQRIESFAPTSTMHRLAPVQSIATAQDIAQSSQDVDDNMCIDS